MERSFQHGEADVAIGAGTDRIDHRAGVARAEVQSLVRTRCRNDDHWRPPPPAARPVCRLLGCVNNYDSDSIFPPPRVTSEIRLIGKRLPKTACIRCRDAATATSEYGCER